MGHLIAILVERVGAKVSDVDISKSKSLLYLLSLIWIACGPQPQQAQIEAPEP